MDDQQFRCRYRDLQPDLLDKPKYGTIFENVLLKTIHALQSNEWTQRGCSVFKFVICTIFTYDNINDQCKSNVFGTGSNGLGKNEYFAYGKFWIRMHPQWKKDYQSYQRK